MTHSKISFDINTLITLAVFVTALALPGLAHAAEAGKFQFVVGDIKVISESGAERVPVKGAPFNSGETIITGPSGTAQIRMSDGGLVAVRTDTQMKLDQYVFNGREDGSERKLVSLIKGGFRAITGLIGNRNKQNYKILTPSATIGIRGTDHEAVVIPSGAAGGFQAGTYDRVYRGATIIETDKGKLIVNPNQVGFTPGKGAAPVLLPKIPEFFNTKSQKPDVVKDTQKESRESDSGDTKKSDTTKGTSTRSLSTLKSDSATSLKETDSGKESATTLRSPLDAATVKDLGTTSLKTESLTTPLSDTTVKSITTTTSVLKDTSSATTTLKSDALTTPITVPTTTLRSTEVLTAPITTTTVKTPTTTTVIAPVTTTITTTPRITESVTVPSTTTILKSTTPTTTFTKP